MQTDIEVVIDGPSPVGARHDGGMLGLGRRQLQAHPLPGTGRIGLFLPPGGRVDNFAGGTVP